MKELNNFKNLGIIFFILFMVSILVLYSEIYKLIEIKKLTNVEFEITASNLVLYISYFISIVFPAILLYMHLKSIKFSISHVNATKEDKEDKDENKEIDIEKLKEKEKRVKEETEKSQLIERIVSELDKENSLKSYADQFLLNLSKEFSIVQGIFFFKDKDEKKYVMIGNYAYYSEEDPRKFDVGDGISGQVAKNRDLINISEIPDDYITVLSGLGKGKPGHMVIFPILYREESVAVIELASFEKFSKKDESLLMGISKIIGPQMMSKF